jgi:DMSO/TMAO reductase YedYZ molybdopterin-dependent catalytic subunit
MRKGMKKRFWIVAFIIMALTFSACQPAVTTPTAASGESGAGDVVLTVEGSKETKTFTLEDLKKLPAIEGQAGSKSSSGKITVPALYKGVLLTDVLKETGGADSTMGIQVEAKDGYAMTFSYDQIVNGDYITYDPATGNEIEFEEPLQTILAYEVDGKPLNAEQDGTLRLMVVSKSPMQVVDGHWTIKFAVKVKIKPLAEEWTLEMDGATTEMVDRGSFESCSASNCHQTSWKDEKAQTWVGTPLYMLVGRVDDKSEHVADDFNDELADKGYTIDVVAKDGYTATFDSARVKDNKDLIVAYQVNDNPLTDKDFPLKLVGSDVQQKEGVGGIAKIVLHLDGSAAETEPGATETTEPVATELAATETPAAAETPQIGTENVAGGLTLGGLVEKEQSWSMDDLKKMEVVKLTVEHPKKGKMDVEGVRLNALLDKAGLKADAATLCIVASDDYKTDVEVKAVRDCPDCLIAFEDDGTLKAVMPGMESGFWAKNVVKIEVK